MHVVAVLFGLTLAHFACSQGGYNFANTGSIRQPFQGQRQLQPFFVANFNQPGFDGNLPNQPGSDGSFLNIPNAAPGQFAQTGDGPFVGGFPNFAPGQFAQTGDGPFVGGQLVEGFPGLVSSRPQSAGMLPLQLVPSFVDSQTPVAGGSLTGQVFNAQAGFQGAGFDAQFARSVITKPITPTVTQTSTIDSFQTLTDLVLHSVPVTQTHFTLLTTTQLTRVVVPTPVNDLMDLETTVIASPMFVTITETYSHFRVVVRTSINYVTLTHTSYAITHVPYTITATQTVRVTSPMVKTVIQTSVHGVTDYRTVAHTVYVHGGYA
ncbi:uncharacterized protein LOC126984269 isoform X1 [Eriocheir sinensis]|uniref:uncharacterized protein LOC126984269 isoform X1 n=1 Tax=Eriocheir sinensis TaxID=95602 RepID=UPI0021C8F9EA|nr:uncharacterized protein LOC126984269 isoform X1 [Eriocheir sinensis]